MVQQLSRDILEGARQKIDADIVTAKREKAAKEKVLAEMQAEVRGLTQKVGQLLESRRQIDLDIGPQRGNQPS